MVTYRGSQNVSSVADKPLSLRFRLRNAKLYRFATKTTIGMSQALGSLHCRQHNLLRSAWELENTGGKTTRGLKGK